MECNHICSYCPAGMADTMTCPEHQDKLKREANTILLYDEKGLDKVD